MLKRTSADLGAHCCAASALLVLGCQIVEGAQNAGNDLLNPDATYVAAPGRMLTSGRHRRLGFDVSEEVGPQVLSLRDADGVSKLRITSLLNGDGCIAGRATNYRSHYGGEALQQGLVSLLEAAADGGAGTLRFVDHSCRSLGDGIERAAFPAHPDPQGPGFFVESGTRLLHVDPHRGRTRELAADVGRWRRRGSELLLIDGGELVVLDSTLKETARLGSLVTRWGAIGSGADAYLAVADGGELVVFDSDYQELIRLDTEFADWQLTREHVWLIDGGELVAFDSDFDEVLRLGSEVTEFGLETGTGSESPDLDQPAVYVDGANLYLLEQLDEPTLVAEDVCQIRFFPSLRRRLSYLSPCATGRLVLHELETDEQQVYGEGVTSVVDVRSREEGGFWVLYLTGSSDAHTLWLQAPDESPIEVAQKAELALQTTACPGDDLTRMWINCEADRCDLIEWGGGAATQVVARQVARKFTSAILADFDGTVGELRVWTPAADAADATPPAHRQCELAPYASGVPVQRYVSDNDENSPHATHAAAFIMDYDGQTGTLALTTPHFTFNYESGPLEEPRRVAEGVPIGGFDFLFTYPGVAYLADADLSSRIGTLLALNSELDATTRISGSVSEFIEWPGAGIVYAIPTGERAGIWYAEFK